MADEVPSEVLAEEGGEETKNKPVEKFRTGRVVATIWANKTEKGTFHSVTVSRLYKNAEGNWRDTKYLDRDDVPQAREVLRRAWLWIYDQNKEK